MQEELLTISWLYPAKVVKECTAQPSKVSLSDDHQFEVLALKLPITIEEAGFKSLILDKKQIEIRIECMKLIRTLAWRSVKAREEAFLFSPSLFQLLNTLVNYTNHHVLKLEGVL